MPGALAFSTANRLCVERLCGRAGRFESGLTRRFAAPAGAGQGAAGLGISEFTHACGCFQICTLLRQMGWAGGARHRDLSTDLSWLGADWARRGGARGVARPFCAEKGVFFTIKNGC